MNAHLPFRTLAVASLLALSFLGLLGTDAHAGPIQDKRKQECIQGGHEWSDKLGCADKNCSDWYGRFHPGETLVTGGKMYMCDGYTGNWIEIKGKPVPPTGPAGGAPASSGVYTSQP